MASDRSIAAPLWAIGALAAIVILYFGRVVLIPLVLSLLVAYTLAPIVGWLQARGLPRLAATLGVMTVLAFGIVAGGSVLTQQAVALIEQVPQAARQAREQIQASRQRGTLKKIERATEEIERSSQALAGAPRPASPSPAAPAGLELGTFFWQGSTSLMALAGHGTVIFFLVLFMLLSDDLFRRKALRIAGRGSEQRQATTDVLDQIGAEIKRYLLVRLLTTIIVGVVTWGALAWYGLQNAPIWGLIAGICNVIPYLGPVIVSAGLALVGFLQFGTLTDAAAVAGIAVVITALEGWLLDPPLMGKAARMNTVAILVGLMFWTAVWGAWGALLAVPMLSITKTICDHVESLKPVGELLGE